MEIKTISVQDLSEVLASRSGCIIDVRNPDEYQAGHVPSARNMPLGTFSVEDVERVSSGQSLYIICAAGVRSQKACEDLALFGVVACNVEGGTKAWIERGLEISFPDEGS